MLRNVLRHQMFDYFIATFLVRSVHSSESKKPLDSDLQALNLVRECCELRELAQAKRVHSSLLQSGIKSLKVFSKYLIRMYASCGSLEDARKAFDNISQPDVISWTELITAYARNGMGGEAFSYFRRMLHEGTRPDIISLLAALNSCKDSTHLEQGKLVHALICETGYETDSAVGTGILVMYGRCGGGVDASKRLFLKLKEKDAASPLCWSTMMKMFIQNGENEKALKLFAENKSPQKLDCVTALEACQTFRQVEEVHTQVFTRGLEAHPSVAAALIEAYGRCGKVDAAEQLLQTLSTDDSSACWTKLIAAFARHGYEKQALEKFHEMQHKNIKPIAATFVAVLDACAGLGALVEGKLLHKRLVEVEKVDIDATVASSLINMYSKCGRIEEGYSVFAEVSNRDDLGLWNTLVDAFAVHGQGYLVLRLFQQMQQEGVRPDQQTFCSLLFVCCYVGLIEAGYAFFAMLRADHGLAPSLGNYVRMIDLLGRAGELDEARKLIERSPFQSSAAVWTSYLAACRSRGDVERGKQAAVRIFGLDPTSTTAVVVLSRIYAYEGRSDMMKGMQKLRGDQTQEAAARSWIEIRGVVHEFSAGDKFHPQAEEIFAALEKLGEVVGRKMEVSSSSSKSSLVMHDVEEEGEDCLWVHSERMALVFGMMMSSAGDEKRLVIFKNRRVCGDCHTLLALVSGICGREIVVRDSSRFHVFSDGSCSCGNFW